MTPAEHQQIMDIAELQVNKYFDHYLTDVFPDQMIRMFGNHNQDAEAHNPRFVVHLKTCPTQQRLNKVMWTLAGGSAVVGFGLAIVVRYLPNIVKVLTS
jgi:hypothetical protein